MLNADNYISELLSMLQETFGERLLYVGLQGSYLRNEATEDSDIDIMVLIDELSVRDMDTYQSILKSVGDFERSCGFICGKAEMANWNPLEICQLLHTTKDYFGTLLDYVPAYTLEDERNFVSLSLDNLYHILAHGYIHSDRDRFVARLPMAFKSVFFIVQNMYYLSSGTFVATKRELIELVGDEDKAVLELGAALDSNNSYEFDQTFNTLFSWCQRAITRV